MKGLIPEPEWVTAATVPAEEIHQDSLSNLLPSYDVLRIELREYIEAEGFSFLGVHCCRPLSLEGYYAEGFQPLSDRHARRLLSDYGNGRLNSDEVDQIMGALDLGCRRGLVMFSVGFPEDVDDHSRHYLLIGPEFFCEITKDRQVPEELRLKFGAELDKSTDRAIPTIFIVAVPFSSMSEEGKDWIVEQLVVGHLWLSSCAPKRSKEWPRQMSMACSGVVPSSAIIGHVHPAKLVDFMYGRREVTGHATRCNYCK